MNGTTLARWFKKNKFADLEKAFDGILHELYDHKDAVPMTDNSSCSRRPTSLGAENAA